MSSQNNQSQGGERSRLSPEASAKNEFQNSNYLPPILNPPKGGGSLRSIDDKFQVNQATGTATLSIPIQISAARSDMTPDLTLSYDSGLGNGPFGLGWALSLPSISRRTSKGVPNYEVGSLQEQIEDVFLFSGVEDLVPKLSTNSNGFMETNSLDGQFVIRQYAPRTEGSFFRIERWSHKTDLPSVHWRTISKSNVTSIYGLTSNSRISDPSNCRRIFRWLIALTYDAKGNSILYNYKSDDQKGINLDLPSEAHRSIETRSTNRYIKSILYGNKKPSIVRDSVIELGEVFNTDRSGWMFETVFDYGDHTPDAPLSESNGNWTARKDSFSSYKSGFELRTTRLCTRVLMFHHMREELGLHDCLISSTELSYSESSTASHLNKITQVGFSVDTTNIPSQGVRTNYLRKEYPSIYFEYSQLNIANIKTNIEIRQMSPEAMDNLPFGLSYTCNWIDIDGEGKPSVLYANQDRWYIKRNLSNFVPHYNHTSPLSTVSSSPTLSPAGSSTSNFAPDLQLGRPEIVTPIPNLSLQSTFSFFDLDGNGTTDLLVSGSDETGFAPGFWRRTQEDPGWCDFNAFPQYPSGLDIRGPHVKLMDLTLDGKLDVICSGEDNSFWWYPGLAAAGFEEARRTQIPSIYDIIPNLNTTTFDGKNTWGRNDLSNNSETIYLADFTGDGLTDLVRVRNGDISYWPNIGYGQFGARVRMNNSPWMDTLDNFSFSRLLFGDIDGSGCADLLYFSPDGGLKIWINEAGNGFSRQPVEVPFPQMDDISSLKFVDLFGNGTGNLFWSSSSPRLADGTRFCYAEFNHGLKPHLLKRFMKGPIETQLEYKPSSQFCQDDKLSGSPWPTKLPFPVQCLSSVRVFDYVSGNYNLSEYTYHHGFFDGMENEFRGFGMVETVQQEYFFSISQKPIPRSFPNQMESFANVLSSPRILSKKWYSTGAYFQAPRVTEAFRTKYYSDDILAKLGEPISLRPPTIDSTITPEDTRQAYRCVKGLCLREEIYQADGSLNETIPFLIRDSHYVAECLQPSDTRLPFNSPGIFHVISKEHLNIQLERQATDHRITHRIILESDNFGNATKSVDIKYGRDQKAISPPHPAEDRLMESNTVVLYTEQRFTNSIDTSLAHVAPLPASSKQFQVYGTYSEGHDLFSESDFGEKICSDTFKFRDFPLKEYTDDTSTPGIRLIGASQIRYRSDDLSHPLPLGALETMAIRAETYTLALTADVLSCYKSIPGDVLLSEFSVMTQRGSNSGGYIDLENNYNLWVPSGTQKFIENPAASPESELAAARASFFTPVLFEDSFGQFQTVTYDENFLFPAKIIDALGNTSSARYSYASMQPKLLTDANGNQHAFVYDQLGSCVYQAIMGSPGIKPTGDSLDDSTLFHANQVSLVSEFLTQPVSKATSILGNATSCTFFGFPTQISDGSWSPGLQISMARDTHINDINPSKISNLQLSISYFDGTGRKIQTKQYAEPDNEGSEWIGQYTIFTQNGDALRRFQPLYDPSHIFSRPRPSSPSSATFFDALRRSVATLNSDTTWSKTIYGPWNRIFWDEGDTIELDPLQDNDVSHYFARFPDPQIKYASWLPSKLSSEDPLAQTAATQSLLCSKTPTEFMRDVLGNEYCTILNNGNDKKFATTKIFNVQRHQKMVVDSMDRTVSLSEYDMLGRLIHSSSMESGQKWTLNNVNGQQIFSWDSRGTRERRTYDPLRRLSQTYIKSGSDNEYLSQHIIYGEQEPEPEVRNLRGRVYQTLDQALKTANVEYDYAGNVITSQRQPLKEYKVAVDWASGIPVEFEDGVFESKISFDALKRPVCENKSDGSSSKYIYNRQGLLQALHGYIGSSLVQETEFITEIKYNANHQPTSITYGNGANCEISYNDLTTQMNSKKTTRADKSVLQAYHYTRDCMGNITHIEDSSQQDLFFRGTIVKPTQDFTYDALGRLTSATGREHLGQRGKGDTFLPSSSVSGVSRVDNPADAKAMASYTETYTHDSENNILSMAHSLSDASTPGWTRQYLYEEPSFLEPSKKSNRLTSTSLGGALTKYHYDDVPGANGLMSSMPGVEVMKWDPYNQLSMTSSQRINSGSSRTPELTYYRYDGSGNRIRKVTERSTDGTSIPTKLKDHLYIEPGYDTFTKYKGNGKTPKSTLRTTHFFALSSTIASVETSIPAGATSSPNSLMRYMLSDHTGSVTLILDIKSEILSQQEYSPYGHTMLESSNSEVPKRYRYSGKELDKSTGLYYFGRRYLMPWLGRWLSPDPMGILDGCNVWCYCGENPVGRWDVNGLMMAAPRPIRMVAHTALALDEGPPAPQPPAPRPPTPPFNDILLARYIFSRESAPQIRDMLDQTPTGGRYKPQNTPSILLDNPFPIAREAITLYSTLRLVSKASRDWTGKRSAEINTYKRILRNYPVPLFEEYHAAARVISDRLQREKTVYFLDYRAFIIYEDVVTNLNLFLTWLKEQAFADPREVLDDLLWCFVYSSAEWLPADGPNLHPHPH